MYSLLEALDILCSKNSDEEQSALDGENNKHIIYPSYQSTHQPKKCDNQCVNCFLPFCLRDLI